MTYNIVFAQNLELTSGSRTTAEFSELCKMLKINPPVNKYRKYSSKKAVSVNRQSGKFAW